MLRTVRSEREREFFISRQEDIYSRRAIYTNIWCGSTLIFINSKRDIIRKYRKRDSTKYLATEFARRSFQVSNYANSIFQSRTYTNEETSFHQCQGSISPHIHKIKPARSTSSIQYRGICRKRTFAHKTSLLLSLSATERKAADQIAQNSMIQPSPLYISEKRLRLQAERKKNIRSNRKSERKRELLSLVIIELFRESDFRLSSGVYTRGEKVFAELSSIITGKRADKKKK